MKKIIQKKILIPAFALVILFSGTAFKNDFFEIAKQIEIFTTLFKELNMNYVDETNPGDLMDTAIKNMLNDLDPYTRFLNEQDVEAARINKTGDYTGIGASVKTKKDKLVVIEPYKDYPADKAGIKAGDEIIKIDDVYIKDHKENASSLLQGSAGTTINITYKRQGETVQTTVKREAVKIRAVPHFSMIDNTTGYIVLRKFNQKASTETVAALRDLKNKGAKQIILDLRGNPGGLLGEAVNVTNIFVPNDQLVVTTKSKVKKYNKTYVTKKDPIDTQIPLVVLIDERSASASEIVAGSLQDLDRAVIIGARSFGKGLVQRPKRLTYGTQVKITISRYYTPSGRCIQALDYWNRDEEGKATRTEKEDFNVFKTKNGRTVYDGGGIQPDIELDISKHSPITKAILNDNLIFDYATQYYYDNEEPDLNSFKLNDSDFDSFKNFLKAHHFNFETKTEKAFNEALSVAKAEKIDAAINNNYDALISTLNTYKNEAIDDNKTQLLSLLSDEIIKRYFYREGLYTHYVGNNAEIQKGIEILKTPKKYSAYLK